jgi:hypothetical protein
MEYVCSGGACCMALCSVQPSVCSNVAGRLCSSSASNQVEYCCSTAMTVVSTCRDVNSALVLNNADAAPQQCIALLSSADQAIHPTE